MPRVTLIGYYGRDNLGDDLMLAALLDRLDRSVPDLTLDVCAAAPLPFPMPASARTIVTPSIGGRLAKLRSLATADLVIWGGGTCLYEDGPGGIAGLRGLHRALTLCRVARTRFVLLAVGLGELHTAPGRDLVRRIISGCDAIYCRDEVSRERSNRMVGEAKARPAGDLAFLAPPGGDRSDVDDQTRVPRTVAFCGASYYATNTTLIQQYREMIGAWLDAGVETIRFVPMHRGRDSDHAMHEQLASGLPADRHELVSYGTPEEALRLLATADVAVSFRLHGVALADMIGLPCLAVAYSPKVSYYCGKIGDAGKRRLRDLGAEITPGHLVDVRDDRHRHGREFDDFVTRESQAADHAVADVCRLF